MSHFERTEPLPPDYYGYEPGEYFLEPEELYDDEIEDEDEELRLTIDIPSFRQLEM